MRKRLLSVFMVLALIIAMAPAAFAAEVETFDTWDGVSSTTPEQIGGVYQIDSAADLVGFAALVNAGNYGANAALLTGIDLGGQTFIPIGAYAYKNETAVEGGAYYSGTFNGNNHTIKNGSIASASNIYNMGIFGFVNGGHINSLNAVNITVNSSATEHECSTGTIIGILYHGSASYLTAGEGCSVSGNYRVGGVIGSVRDECTVSYCHNYADVDGGNNYTGGIVGAAHDMDYEGLTFTGAPATISYCDNHGEVSGTNEVGGIVGYTDQTTVDNCNNYGSVTATGNYGSGGIVGFDAYNPRYFLGFIPVYIPDTGATISNCSNSASVNGPRSGGILGTLGVTPGEDQPDSSKTLTKITNCTNSGNITGTDGKCGSIYGYPITYAHGDGPEYIGNLKVLISGCTTGGTVNGATPTIPTPGPYVTQ